MTVKQEVIKYMMEHKGEPFSGARIAAALGVSRNSVWKAVTALRGEGYEINGTTNKGYTFISSNNVLSVEGIQKFVQRKDRVDVRVLQSVDSTNNYVKRLAADGGEEGVVVVSEEQTAGKGRLGRHFESPKKTGIYMSILLRPKFSAEKSLAITTIAAVAVARAIEDVTGYDTRIKWVNDIYLRGRKVVGILTEASVNFENAGLEYAVTGIGINVQYPEGGFPEEIKHIAGAIFTEECADDTRCRIVARILDYFFDYYDRMPNNSYIEEYRRRSLLTGRDIAFTEGEVSKTGLVKGIDDECRLIVQMPDGEIRHFSTGEVSIKKTFLGR